jgi:predicted  nucleic acid-binding Zn-ribbon protein
MLNPLALPNEVGAALRSVTAIERLLDERLRGLERRFESLDAQMARLPTDIERTLRHHFEGQRGDLAQLHDELVANREQAEKLPGKVDGLREEIGAVRGVLREVLAEIAEVRETVEPLQGPAERAARLSERLPGGS